MTRRLFYFLGQLWLCLKKTIFEYFRVQNWHVSYFLFYCFVFLDSFTIKSFYPVTLVSFKIYECFVYDASKYFYVTHKILCEGCFFCSAFFSILTWHWVIGELSYRNSTLEVVWETIILEMMDDTLGNIQFEVSYR